MGMNEFLVPGTQQAPAENIEDIVKRTIKKAEKKRERREDGGGKELELIGEIQVLSTIGQVQQNLVSLLQNPPTDPATGAVITTLSDPPVFGLKERAVLRWNTNATVLLATNTYNVISALRGEMMLALLSNGLTGQKKRSGLFGGGISSLLIISSLGGGNGLGLGGILGGGGLASPIPGSFGFLV